MCTAGIVLFVLGLLNGLIIPRTTAPRLSLSAHLTAVQSGTFLIAIAWAWPYLNLSVQGSLILAWILSASLFVLWFAFFWAGIWGGGRGLPIAGAGSSTGSFRQTLISVMLAIGIFGTVAASVFLLYRRLLVVGD